MLLLFTLLQVIQIRKVINFYTAVPIEPDKFPAVTGMWPVRGMTAGGSRITFSGQHLDSLPDPLGAYFIPSNGLPHLYGFVHSRSEGFKWILFAQFARIIGAEGGTKTTVPSGYWLQLGRR